MQGLIFSPSSWSGRARSELPFRNTSLGMKCEGWIRWRNLEDQTLVKNENEDFDDTKKSSYELSLH